MQSLAPTLLLDTTLSGLTLAVVSKTQAVREFSTEEPRSGVLLHTHLQDLLAHSGLKLMDIQHLILTIGPGSFTGIRLGLAFAEALKLANPSLKITAVSTLQAVATQFAGPKHLTIWLDAAGGMVYQQTFDSQGQPLTEPACLPQQEAEDDLQPGTTLVTATNLLADNADHLVTHLEAKALLTTAQNTAFHRPAQPFYLKPLTYKVSA